ncbi:MAG TPA: hypothetical protein VH394_19785 [Thermoanaerobaculia bacterium]|nr:hypothetical protein [Thermoanaerobaculia bacterium]
MRSTRFAAAFSLLGFTWSWLASLWPVAPEAASDETDRGFTIDPNG